MTNKNSFAPTAPMGWNSYDYYCTAVTEDEVKANADYMAKNLKQFGYEYVVIDIEWYSNDAATTDEYQYIPFGDNVMDEYGRFQPSPLRFPSSADGSGFTKLAEYVHSLGLKFGIHIMRGIPRLAAHQHCRVYGCDARADQIAEASSICGWNPDMYGVKNTPEGQIYYDGLIQMYADWGVDFIKCDDICDTWTYRESNHNEFTGWEETRMLHRAIMKTGRPIVLSLSPGPAQLPRAHEYAVNANMWRITDDFWDEWELLKPMFWRCETWLDHVKPGCFPDCDMLPVGKIGGKFQGHPERMTGFNREEQKTMMSLWCMFGAPLMIGCDMTQMDDWTLSVLTNRDMLAMLDGNHLGYQVTRNDNAAVWANVTTGEKEPAMTLGLFNLSDEEAEVTVTAAMLEDAGVDPAVYGLSGAGETALAEVWGEAGAAWKNGAVAVKVPAHGVRVFKVQ